MKENSKKIMVFSVVLFLLIIAGTAFSQEKFPTRPINLILPWAPGGGGMQDALALQAHLEKALGVKVIIVNKPGGGGTIGWNFVANAPADGYSVGVINPSWISTRYTTKTGVSLDKFEPFIFTVISPSGLAVRADSPWNTFDDFIKAAKANPGKVEVGNSGYAAMYHFTALGLEIAAGVKFNNVPFKGGGPTITGLLGGHVQSIITQVADLLPFVEAKRFRILTVFSPERNVALPHVPAIKEYGIDLDVATWYVYVVPKGTPRDRIKILHDAFLAAKNSQEYKTFYETRGGMTRHKDAENLPVFLSNQDKIWKKIIDYGGFKQED